MADKRGILVCIGGSRFYKNIGDYIQSIAAMQFAGSDAVRLEREFLDAYAGDPVRVVMNAWFMHHPERFPPSAAVHPFFVSFHLRPEIADAFLTPRTLAYLKAHEPIGCRSTEVVELLRRHGVDAWFSSCLTLTLGATYRHVAVETPPVFVDPYFPRLGKKRFTRRALLRRLVGILPDLVLHGRTLCALAEKFKVFVEWPRIPNRWARLVYAADFRRMYASVFPDRVLTGADYLSHTVSKKIYPDEASLFAKADETLRRYERAPFVVTSRLHCAFPCLAMRTPCWTIIDPQLDRGRFGGNREFLTELKVSENGRLVSSEAFTGRGGRFKCGDRPAVGQGYLTYASKLASACRRFMDGQDGGRA